MKHQLYDRSVYVPMTYPLNATMYRVPMWIDGDEYTVAVGQDEFRIFTDDTLPDVIKAKLSMIKAFPKNVMPYYLVNALTPYKNNHDERLDGIGWQVTEEMYMLVIPNDQLQAMRFKHDT